MRNINMKRLNRDGEIQVKTLSGARISTLQQVIAGMSTTKAIKKLVLHAGTNNIAGRRDADSVSQCVEQYNRLLDTARTKMPDAKIAVSAVPPLKPWGKCKTAHQLNDELSDLCHQRGVVFLPHKALWEKDEHGKLDPNLLADNVHFTQLGLGLYLQETKALFVGARNTVSGHKKGQWYESAPASHTNNDSNNRRGSYAAVTVGLQEGLRDDRSRTACTTPAPAP
jgi:hypothetical protein